MTRDKARADIKNKTQTRCAFFCAALCCVLGLAFCLVKSPQEKSRSYLAAAIGLSAPGDLAKAHAAAAQSVRLDPSNDKGWLFFSAVLDRRGDHAEAAQARRIAARLQQGLLAGEAFYALPAELKLSLLSSPAPEQYR